MNLERRPERLTSVRRRLSAASIYAETFPAVDARSLSPDDTHGFLTVQKRACALSKRRVLREAGHRDHKSVLIFEDDVVFHPKIHELLESIILPEDWGIFYLGCMHVDPPAPHSPGLVRVTKALDCHAVAVRDIYYHRARAIMRGHGHGKKGDLHSDVQFSLLQSEIPSYAVFPNLAWQARGYSDIAGEEYSNYDENGRQVIWEESVRDLQKVLASPARPD